MLADVRFEQAIDKHRLRALILGPVSCLAVAYFDLNGTGLQGWVADVYELWTGIFVPWCCLVAFFGYGRRLFRSGGRVLKYAATASIPVYLLRQVCRRIFAETRRARTPVSAISPGPMPRGAAPISPGSASPSR